MLEKELEVFNRNKADLLKIYSGGGFVVIKGEEILGVWHDRQDALREGIKVWGDTIFLVKSLLETPGLINFSRNTLIA